MPRFPHSLLRYLFLMFEELLLILKKQLLMLMEFDKMYGVRIQLRLAFLSKIDRALTNLLDVLELLQENQ